MNICTVLGNGLTCVIMREGKTVYKSSHAGIRPLAELIESGISVAGCTAYDKIVGKAAALLYVLAGVAEVNAEVLSKPAASVLASHGIAYTFVTITEQIINRSGTGLCPMEEAVKDTQNPHTALKLIKQKLSELRGDN